jgi:hypothetical protein
MRKTAVFLLAGLLGVAALLSGLALDSYLHARDPNLAHREGLFTLTNPGHVLLGLGIGLVVLGLVGAAYTSLPYGIWVRRGLLAGSLLLIVVSGDVSGWAASLEWSAPHATAQAAHSHAAPAAAAPVTAAQLEAATRLLEQTRAAVARYKDLRVATAAGYGPMEPPDLQTVHYVNPAYFNFADILRPEHVQSLIYYNSARGPVLIGAMYIMPTLWIPGPEIGGQLTVWHQHDNLCYDDTTHMVVAFDHSAFFDRNDKSGVCPRGSSNKRTPEMLHVWVVDNPAGPFDSDMQPDVLAALATAA